MNSKRIAFYAPLIGILLIANSAWGWLIAPRNDHGKLAEIAESCQQIPLPPQKRCETPIDVKPFLILTLKDGAAEPDHTDPKTTTKHSYNPKHIEEWDPAIMQTLGLSSASIGPGDAITAINDEIGKTKTKFQGLTCYSGQQSYTEIWKQFGRLSHYTSDLASPLHVYSVAVNGAYREGDYINSEWGKMRI